jgi:hypothetical protein
MEPVSRSSHARNTPTRVNGLAAFLNTHRDQKLRDAGTRNSENLPRINDNNPPRTNDNPPRINHNNLQNETYDDRIKDKVVGR